MPDPPPQHLVDGHHFADDQHALDAGFLIGHLLACGVDVRPTVDSAGDYTPELTVDVTLPQRRLPLAVRLQVLPRERPQ